MSKYQGCTKIFTLLKDKHSWLLYTNIYIYIYYWWIASIYNIAYNLHLGKRQGNLILSSAGLEGGMHVPPSLTLFRKPHVKTSRSDTRKHSWCVRVLKHSPVLPVSGVCHFESHQWNSLSTRANTHTHSVTTQAWPVLYSWHKNGQSRHITTLFAQSFSDIHKVHQGLN